MIASLPQKPNAKREVPQCLEKLLRILEDVSPNPKTLDAKLAEFVFVPISHVLRASRIVPVRALELSLQCISILLTTGWSGELTPELTGQLLILFTFLANPSSAENGIPATSEELQATALKCMAELIAEISRTPKGGRLLTETQNIPTLSKAVLVMVDSLAEVPSNSVKLQALAAIQALSSSLTDLDALASFLPRMISSLTKVLTPNSSNRANFRVLERGLDTMSLILLRTLGDRETKDLPSQDAQRGPKAAIQVLRTTSWLQASAGQIKIALANVLKLRYHDKKEVRHALLQLCLRIIQDCRASLSECTGMMIEALITLAGRGGDADSVETDLRILLSSDKNLAGLLRESLHGWVISMPRLMQSKDDAGRHQIIHQISVALRLLNSEDMDTSMIDDLLASNLRDSVSTILKDSSGITSVVETPAATDTALAVGKSTSTSFQPLKLRLKGQDVMMNEFKLLLQELAKSKSALVVAQDLVNAINSGTDETQVATFWLSVNLLKDMMQHNSVVDDFLDFGTSNVQTELLDELYTLSLSKLTNPDAEKISHWHMQALSLEVIALQAKRYKTEFRVELIEALYPVLHYLGNPNPGLRNHAMACLNIMAESCEYANASDLIVSNVDYIINAVGLKLNYHDISPQAPQVLLMMMRLCGPSLLPFLDDLVGSMFSALERYHGYPKLVELLFSVLRGMAEEGVKAPQLMIEGDGEKTHKSVAGIWKATSVSDVVEVIKKLKVEALKQDEEHERLSESFPQRPWKEPSEQEAEDPSVGEDEQQDGGAVQEVEPAPPAPRTFDILLKISDLTQHYLTSSSPTLRTSLLSLLHTTIPALARHENSFLPLINTLWPVLLPRLGDSEAYVVSNALEVMSMMCTHAGNFMKGRIEGTWEDLKSIHRQVMKKGNDPRRKKSSHVSELLLPHTQEIKMSGYIPESGLDHYQPEKYVDAPTRMIRESLIGLFCAIARHVMIGEDFFDDVIDMLDPVLEKSDVRGALESRNPDAVWLRLYKKNTMGKDGTLAVETVSLPGPMPVGKPHWKFAQLRV